MDAEEQRLRTRLALFGPSGLNRTDQWRMRSIEQADRRRAYLAEQERVARAERKRAAITTATDELRAELEARRVAHEQLDTELAVTQQAISSILDVLEARDAERDNLTRALKAEIAELRTKLAEGRVEELEVLHRNLIGAAQMAISTLNEATSLAAARVEREQAEEKQREELVALRTRGDALAAELERLRTHRDFKFAREEGDSDVFDLPDFLPPPRRDN
jgi:hypothetical protein